jgi:2-polyprenyl-3-methyl-5-hydroxy-6-metoxy-1,4-benzoquinol methylase
MLRSHAAAIRRWAVLLNTRLHDRTATGDGLPSRPALTENGLATLAVRARPLVRPVADICLREYPAAQRVLDVGGGHGEFALEFARRGLEVTVQDLPEVVKIARRTVRPGAVFGGHQHVRRRRRP